MPDVGVLNLTIRDNSTEAAKGLTSLKKQLEGVKTAAEGYNLGAVSSQIGGLVSSVKGSEKTTAALGTLLNAVKEYHKTFAKLGNLQLNLSPIEQIKTALGDGFNIGSAGTQLNKIREALSGEWNTENAGNVASSLKTIAAGAKELVGTGLNASAKNIGALAQSITELNAAVSGMQSNGLQGIGGLDAGNEASGVGTNVVEGVKSGIESERGALINSAIQMANDAVSAMKQALDIHSPSGITEEEVGVPAGQGFVKGLESTKGEVQVAGTAIAQAAIDAMRSTVENATVDLSKIPAMTGEGGFKNIAEEIKSVTEELEKSKEAVNTWDSAYEEIRRDIQRTGSNEENTGMLGNAEEQFYASVKQVDAYEAKLASINAYVNQYKQNTQEATKATSEQSDVLVRTAQGLVRVSSSIQTTNEAMQGAVAPTKQYYTSIEDAFNGVRNGKVVENDLMSRWLHGEGSKEGQLYALKALAKDLGVTVDEVKHKVQELTEAENSAANASEGIASAQAKANQAAIQRIFDALENPPQYKMADFIKQSMGIDTEPIKSAEDSFRSFLDLIDQGTPQASALRELNPEMLQLKQQLNDAGISANEFTSKMVDVDGELKQKKADTAEAGKGFKDFKKSIASAFPTLNAFGKRIGNIVIRRTIMAALRSVTAGFKEGIQNVYEYSKAVGGTFAPSMDSAASSLAQMKNALGAALAPALQAIIPILNTVISWFVTAINYVNQFFALLRGQTSWTRALPQTVNAFGKQEKAAKGAGAAMKDLLADWDELNIIQSQSGGGGGGAASAAEDYTKMFEEAYAFDGKVRDIVNWVKDNFDTIKTVAEGIGAAILLWRLSEAFGKDLNMLQKLELAAGLTLVITGIKLTSKAGYDIGVNGLNGENALEAVKGILATAFGGGLVGLAFGGIVGGIVGLGIGAALGIAVLALNIHKGQLDSLYGDVHKDVDEIRTELEEGILTIEARASIDVTHAKLNNLTLARAAVSTAINLLKGAYPVAVEITPDNKEDFSKKIKTLVEETNALINTHTDTMTELYVPATAKFDDNFIRNAWGDVKDTVTWLGDEIGKELSKSIVDSTRVDELKKKLMALSEAVMNAQYRGNFAGKVGVAGSKTRENTNMGIFDRETIQAYIDEYNKITDEAKAEAEARAVAERSEAETLVSSLEGSLDIVKSEVEDAKDKGLQGTPEYRELINRQKEIEADLKIAREELEAWEKGDRYNQRVKELYDEWTRGGRTVYAQDISDAVKLAASKSNQLKDYYNAYLTDMPHAGIMGSNEQLMKYFADSKNGMFSALAQSTGMKPDALKKMLGDAGIDFMSLLDPSFVSDYQKKVAEILSVSNLSNADKKKILASFGLDMNYLKQFMNEKEKLEQQEIEKRRKAEEKARKEEEARAKEAYETVKGIVSEKIGSGIQGNEIDNLYRDLLLNYDQGAVDRVWAEIVERLPETKVPVEIEPAVEENKTDETEEAIRKAIQDGIDAGYDPSQMDALLASLVGKYQLPDLIDDIREELENGGLNGNTGKFGKPLGIVGSMGISDVGYMKPEQYVVPVQSTEEETDVRDLSNDVANGTRTGNQNIADGLQTAISYLMRIAAKDLNVTFAPTIAAGGWVGASQGMLNKITGD